MPSKKTNETNEVKEVDSRYNDSEYVESLIELGRNPAKYVTAYGEFTLDELNSGGLDKAIKASSLVK